MTAGPITATAVAQGHTITARWAGGEYAELAFDDAEKAIGIINLWDYAAGAPRVPFTAAALAAELAGWCDDLDPGDIDKAIDDARW